MCEEGGEGMRSKPNSIVLAAAATAMAVLLLSGCQQGSSKADSKPPDKQLEATVDSTEKEDSMKAFYERMRHWEVLHGGMSHRESDK